MKSKKITVIPATLPLPTKKQAPFKHLCRVACYARVSTSDEKQLNSYAGQIEYYTNYVNSQEKWSLVGIYTDYGLSGTSTKHRDGFNRMISEALAGKIDLIITKSVSRFARNTVDSLTIIRKLKENHVECYFEKENIWTLDTKGELLLTIMSSLAQEESRSISENVTWGHRKRFADGKVSVSYSSFLGYEKGKNGNLVINSCEAVTVRRIYSLYLDGYSPYAISKILTQEKIPTPRGKEIWYPKTIQNILTNEKYKGDALLQKTFTVDFLTKKQKKNEGEVPQYYVKNSHPAIIEPKIFDFVQTLLRT